MSAVFFPSSVVCDFVLGKYEPTVHVCRQELSTMRVLQKNSSVSQQCDWNCLHHVDEPLAQWSGQNPMPYTRRTTDVAAWISVSREPPKQEVVIHAMVVWNCKGAGTLDEDCNGNLRDIQVRVQSGHSKTTARRGSKVVEGLRCCCCGCRTRQDRHADQETDGHDEQGIHKTWTRRHDGHAGQTGHTQTDKGRQTNRRPRGTSHCFMRCTGDIHHSVFLVNRCPIALISTQTDHRIGTLRWFGALGEHLTHGDD